MGDWNGWENANGGFEEFGEPNSPELSPRKKSLSAYAVKLWVALGVWVVISLVLIFRIGGNRLLAGVPTPIGEPKTALSVTKQDADKTTVEFSCLWSGLEPDRIYIAGLFLREKDGTYEPTGEAIALRGSETQQAAITAILPWAKGEGYYQAYCYALGNEDVFWSQEYAFSLWDEASGQEGMDKGQHTNAPTSPRVYTILPTAAPTSALAPTSASAATATFRPSPMVTTAHKGTPVPSSPSFHLYPVDVRYYYHQLSDAEKSLFALIYDAASRCEDTVEIELPFACSAAEIDKAMWAIWIDCPELFHVKMEYTAYLQNDEVRSADLLYEMDAVQYERDYDKLVAGLETLSSLFDPSGEDYQKQLAIYRHILDASEYRKDEFYSCMACGPMLYGYGQCDGYTAALTIAMRYYGIPCAQIAGEATNSTGTSAHSWNIVLINGRWYQCDVTWDDPIGGPSYRERLSYFNLTDAQMLQNRTVSQEYLDAWAYPACDSTEDAFRIP